jgi:hypothetical protein
MADLFGFGPVFVTAGAGALGSAALLIARVHEPRHRPSGAS